jgi:hypothetical protein
MHEALEELWATYMQARSDLRLAYVRGEITRAQYQTIAKAYFAFTNAKEVIIKREYAA